MHSDADIQGLIERIRNPDDAVSGAAWQNAGPYGAPAVAPLALLMANGDFELARKARRALCRSAGRAGVLAQPTGPARSSASPVP